MAKKEEKGIEFDPGFGPYILALEGTVQYLYTDINRFKNLSQKKVKFMQYHKKLLDVFYNNVGFYTGCLMWASYILTQPKQKILGNHCFGKEYDEEQNIAETQYMLNFINLFPKDPPLYLKKLRELCDKYNVHLIADEIATGYGRTGKMWAFDHAGVSPDLMCLSKGLTGGYMPMALVVTTQKIYDAFYDDYLKGKAFMHSHTYSGNPLACSAGIEVLNILREEKIIEKAVEKAKYFNKIIKEKFLPLENTGEVRSIGLINAIELVKNKETKEPLDYTKRTGYQIYKKALEKGVILRPLGDVSVHS